MQSKVEEVVCVAPVLRVTAEVSRASKKYFISASCLV